MTDVGRTTGRFGVTDPPTMTGPITDGIAWLTVGLLATGAIVERFDRSTARYVSSAAWLAFVVFWARLVPHFAFVQHRIGSTSITTGLVAVVDAPLRRRARAITVVVPTIWTLDLVRVASITIPELLSIVEEVLSVFTNREYDLRGAFAQP